ncbi:MAG: RidA family protein [Burkholderiales bacterium]|nr:RidA family protein [Burkholderiales bacterium]
MSGYPSAIGPYSAYRKAGDLLFISGQIPVCPESGNVVEGGIKEQTKRSLENVKAILEENGLSFKNVVKTTVFLSDIANFVPMNEVYASYFGSPYPARSAFAVKDLPKAVLVEIEVIASTKT